MRSGTVLALCRARVRSHQKSTSFRDEVDSPKEFAMGKRIVVTVIWVFITVVALADVYITWTFRSSVLEWEANPIAAQLFRWWGPVGLVLFRLGWLAYAKIMSRTHSRLSWLVTPLWGMGHLYLLVTLIQVYPALGVLQRACETQARAQTAVSASNTLDTARWYKSARQPTPDCVVACACQANRIQGQPSRRLLDGPAVKPGATRHRCRALLLG
jgi:hypothetical protein